MADGKLLDTNVISVLADANDPRYANVRSHLMASTGSIMLPVIAIAEIEFGMVKAGKRADPRQQADMRAFFARYPLHLGVDDWTVEPYALIRAKIWEVHAKPRPRGRGHNEKDPIELFDRITGKELGIDERDLLIVSVAVQYNLVLATLDRNLKMTRIEEAAADLEAEGRPVHLRVEDWNLPLAGPGTTSN